MINLAIFFHRMQECNKITKNFNIAFISDKNFLELHYYISVHYTTSRLIVSIA